MDSTWIWAKFGALSTLILVSGYFLCLYGDALAEKFKLGRSWVGAILLATVTSLPELAAGVSAVTVTQAPDLVAGELLGSCVFNLFLIVILDFVYRKQSMFTLVDRSQALTAAFGILLIGFTGLALLTSQGVFPMRVGHVGWYSFFIPVFYFFAMKELFTSTTPQTGEAGEGDGASDYAHLTPTTVLLRYMMAGAVVVGASMYLPVLAEDLVKVMGWNEAFVGTTFVAFTTSLPEAAVTLSAISLGAMDLALGNLVGSNLFNMMIFPICDFLFVKGPIFDFISTSNGITSLSAVAMSALVIIGIMAPPRRRVLGMVSWISFMLAIIYFVNTFALFR